MLEDIELLLKQGKHLEALNIIEQRLKETQKIKDDNEEEIFKQLLKMRIRIKDSLNQDDELILDLVHKKRFFGNQEYSLDDKYYITMMFQSIFLFKCDAYVNTIHVDKLFNIAPRSASQGFVKRLSKKEVDRQVEKHGRVGLGEFLILQHPKLPAPMSYHIVCYKNEDEIDYEALTKGLQSVLDDASNRKLNNLGCVSLGFDAIASAQPNQKNQLAEQITDKVAETIVNFFWETKYKQVPRLNFGFVNMNSYNFYDRAFAKWTHVDKNYVKYKQQFDENMRKLTEEVYTRNAEYLSILKKIRPELNEKSSFLLLGETGVGKSFLAKLIHKYSNRSHKPFELLNCGLIKKDHIYTHLFGWKKGSYTGALFDSEGLIEKADGGTLFLDEVGNMDLDVQNALMSFLDDGCFRRFGETQTRKTDVRIIWGTNRNLDEAIRLGEFKNDLYERISQVELKIPPLRNRPDDILLIAQTIIKELNLQKNFNLTLDDKAEEHLSKFKWPGNIRQLQTYLERMHNECSYENMLYVNDDWITKNPPRDYLYKTESLFDQLESTLGLILSKWNESNGKLLDELIEPILARIYIDTLARSKEESSKLIGLDGSGGKNSTLTKRYRKYSDSRKLIDTD